MKTSFEIHPIQAHILRVLTFHPEARFAQMNELKMPTDQFTFHVNSLVEANLIEKLEKGLYQLTETGKELANRFDTETASYEKQGKVSVIIGCVKGINKQKLFLIQQRLKQPYYGYFGFISGKIPQGATPVETAIKELREETGLSAKKLKLVGVRHKMDYSKEGNLLEDKYFFIIKATGFSGELVEIFEGGKNQWLSNEELLKLDHRFDGVDETIEFITGKTLQYTEHKFIVSGF